jgi:Protein of unknown function (DUF2889)
MRLAVRGHPLHSRALTVELAGRDDGRLDARASVLDLRKRGFVPVAGDLQGSGIVHHMRLVAVVDPAARTLASVVAEQPTVAFEPSATTAGESCRDPIHVVEALAGCRLDADFAPAAGATLGGPRGCSHVLTLAHLLGSTAAWALGRETSLHGAVAPRRPGERVFRRDLVVDGFECADGTLELAAQTTDLHFAPAPARARPMERFAEELEVRVHADVAFPSFELRAIEAGERRRDAAGLDGAPWRGRDDVTATLGGERLGAGITARLLARLADRPDDRPLLDTLLMLAPTLVQCAAALSEQWPAMFAMDPSRVGMGGLPDSCWMWRRGGALDQARAADGVALPIRRR